ncbi:MAG: glycosyltransferase family 1 protein [Vicinamibacterales bacterium]
MTRLRIGVDARELLGATTGVGRYLGELLVRWTARADASVRQFLLYAPEPIPLTFPPRTVDYRILRTGNRPGRGTWWEQMHLRRAVAKDRPEVFFAPAYTAPLLSAIPLALTIHDISFVVHPEWFRYREGIRRRWLTRRSADTAAVVFTDSEFSRSEIVAHLRIDRNRVKVIPPGLAARHESAASAQGRQPIVLFVGSIFNRRRVPDLIAAFAGLARDVSQARLVIVGDDRSWPPQSLTDVAARFGIASRVDFKSYVSDAELAELYRTASVFAFLSEYEGFGFTPLEALSAGVPIVVADTPVAREVYGAAAHYVPVGDVARTTTVLEDLLRGWSNAAEAMRHAPDVLSRYSWDRAANETLSHIERIAQR